MDLRVTTFNIENLFNRYAFLDEPWGGEHYEQFVQAIGVVSIAGRQGDLVPEPTTVIQRNNTALAIEAAQPDILVVEEVENIHTLRIFNEQFLDQYFGEIILLEGNDPRGIDIGLLVKKGLDAKIRGVRTHIDDREDLAHPVVRRSVPHFGYIAQNAVFSRDCLEVDIDVSGKALTFVANHLKAQDSKNKASADKRRKKQAERVAEIVDAVVAMGRLPIVLGDLNAPNGHGSLMALQNHAELQDPFVDLGDSLWTHFYAPKTVSRLDYILPHKSLKVKDVDIVRRGLSTKCKRADAPLNERFPTIGPMHTEASDHCPTTAILEL